MKIFYKMNKYLKILVKTYNILGYNINTDQNEENIIIEIESYLDELKEYYNDNVSDNHISCD